MHACRDDRAAEHFWEALKLEKDNQTYRKEFERAIKRARKQHQSTGAAAGAGAR